jgi:hypothetical protein
VAATALVVNQGYRIVSLGNTNWQTVGAGASAAIGTVFSCEAVGTGTGTAQRVDCRRVTAQALAALAGVAAAILAHSQAEDPHPGYTTAQELSNALQGYLTASAAAQAYQPLDPDLTALAAVADQTAFGRAFLALVDQAAARDCIGLGPDDSATLTGLTLSGLANLPHIHGNLAGGLYAHVKNLSGGALAAGTPLRITGTVGDTTTLQVVAASASSAETMPALFVLSEALPNNNDEGHATLLGEITGLNTAGMTPGAPLFVPSGGGVLTATRPAANAQQMATVGRVHATTGSVHVLPWPVLGTAAAAAIDDFATAAQGLLAGSAVQPGALAVYALLSDSRFTDAREWSAATVEQAEAEARTATTRRAWTAERVGQAIAAWWTATTSTVGRAVATAADQAAARTAIGAGTSNLALGSATPANLAGTASAGTASAASREDHVHARSTYAELGAIGDGIVFVISNRGETATPSTNYDESLPLSLPITVAKITFITHIDNTGSSTTTLSAYKRTAAGTKTALLSANATLASGASVAIGSLSSTAGVLSLADGDRLGVDLIGLGTGASGIKCIIEYTRSAV